MATDRARIDDFKRRIEEEWQDPRVTDGYRTWDRHESEWGFDQPMYRDVIVGSGRKDT